MNKTVIFVTLFTSKIYLRSERATVRPRGTPPSASSGLALSVPASIPCDQVSVLIADDDPLVCRLAQNILAQDDYHILTACDGQQALDVAVAHPGPLHLLLSDVTMPGLSGPELCKQIKHERPDVVCVLMSGDLSGPWVDGELPFISKPFTPDVLRRKVRELLQGAERQSTELAKYRPNPDQKYGV